MPRTKKTNTTAKRIVMLASDKGGVGKSFFAYNLVDWIARYHPEVPFMAFDPDERNRTLKSHHDSDGRVLFLDVSESSNLDAIGACLADVDLSIVDGLGSLQTKTFGSWIEEVSLYEILESIGAKLTFVHLIQDDADVIRQARESLESTPENVDFLLVLNPFKGGVGALWRESKTRKAFLDRGALEIQLPVCTEAMSQALHKHAAPAMRMQEIDAKLSVFDANRFRYFAGKLAEAFDSGKGMILP